MLSKSTIMSSHRNMFSALTRPAPKWSKRFSLIFFQFLFNSIRITFAWRRHILNESQTWRMNKEIEWKLSKEHELIACLYNKKNKCLCSVDNIREEESVSLRIELNVIKAKQISNIYYKLIYQFLKISNIYCKSIYQFLKIQTLFISIGKY